MRVIGILAVSCLLLASGRFGIAHSSLGHPLKVPIKTKKLRHRLSQPNLFFFG